MRSAGDDTELMLRHSGWGGGAAAEEAVALHEQGWSFFLDNLVAYLERGEDLRPGAPMGQKTPATVGHAGYLSRRESLRSFRSRPPVWQRGQ